MSATTTIISQSASQSAIRSPVSEFYRRFKRQRIAMASLVDYRNQQTGPQVSVDVRRSF